MVQYWNPLRIEAAKGVPDIPTRRRPDTSRVYAFENNEYSYKW